MSEENLLQTEWVDTFRGMTESISINPSSDRYAPFMEPAWLCALEDTGCIGPGTGWEIHNLKMSGKGGTLAYCPLFRKTQSEGEFVWDYPWADIGKHFGVPYFPKLTGMSPFTPVPAYRFLVADGADEAQMTVSCLEEIKGHLAQENLYGAHFQYVDEKMKECLSAAGFCEWKHHRYVWENEGLESFDELISRFNKNQARNIRREMHSLAEQGLSVRSLTNEELTPGAADQMYDFYENTNDRFGPWGCKYLNRDFFREIFRISGERLLLFAAYQKASPDKPVGMSMLVRKKEWLYGRYWGSRDFFPNLHFNLCFYAPFEWAIKNHIRYFDPGLGSEHKARRGFRSTSSSSFHYFRDEMMGNIFRHSMTNVNRDTEKEIKFLDDAVPIFWRKKGE